MNRSFNNHYIHSNPCAVCSHSLVCYEISQDSLLLKTNADVKKFDEKLKEHDATKRTSKSRKASESSKLQTSYKQTKKTNVFLSQTLNVRRY